ncbi:MAG: LysM peptidoglycan-binding domain-containing protein [Bacilli bacterium]|nr:LysM peptidoglycan-binding domain-containing protein [Bacilli bacterium]MDD4406615.1 LysM peptidoglycan-binding domain-containing protein [Bacilli bacterium]
MNETFILDKELMFKSNIYEITSLSIEHSYDVVGSNCEGEFILSGEYRLHEVSINKEDFSFRIPFSTELRSNVNLDSVEVDINDFSYELNEDVLEVHIEYLIRGEQSLIEFAEEADLDEFLKNNEAEIVDLSEEEKVPELNEESDLENDDRNDNDENHEEETAEPIDQLNKENIIIPDIPIANEERHHEDKTEVDEIKEEPKVTEVDKNTIINSINSEESFITYHVHTVIPSDTFESICALYNTNLNDLKKYNNVDELILNMKLIIPDEEN